MVQAHRRLQRIRTRGDAGLRRTDDWTDFIAACGTNGGFNEEAGSRGTRQRVTVLAWLRSVGSPITNRSG